LRTQPEKMGLFVEELLRLESPVQGQFRQALADTEIGGVRIPKGTLLHVRLASANRDEQIFGEDDDQPKLDHKPPAPHRSFGMGMHFCLGAMLSRLELKVALAALLDRFSSIELAVAPGDLRWHTHFHLRGLEELPVVVNR
ncbi:MAG: cytochrome P450, partial [Gammaproteobacteria bacterium]|nr:cytochrome P450 [Gammaproteobacteria bacterium]